MKPHAFLYSLFLILYSSFSHAQVPSTEIYLIKMEKKDGAYTFGEPKNITRREGYDNQPFFLYDSRTILYTSIREDKQADVYKYDIKKKKTKRVTRTPEDEYSPTLMPDGRHFSVVRVEKDSTQRLWKFDMKGRNPELILPDIKGVGYHAWKNDSEVVLFMLGDTFSLQLANIRTGEVEVLDNQIGRSIVVSYGGFGIYYVSKKDSTWYIMEIGKLKTHGVKNMPQRIAQLPKGVEDFTMDWDYNIYSGCGDQLLYYGSKRVSKDIEPKCADLRKLPAWQILHDLSGTPAARFYRLAFSPNMKYMAVVVYSGEKP
jgi:hypothetical protein